MKAIVYALIAIAAASFLAALAGYWWQGVICGIAALTAYVIDADLETQEAQEKAKQINK